MDAGFEARLADDPSQPVWHKQATETRAAQGRERQVSGVMDGLPNALAAIVVSLEARHAHALEMLRGTINAPALPRSSE